MRINGDLVFNSDGSGTFQNAFFERYVGGTGGSTLPTGQTTAGRIIFNTSDNYFYYWNGTSWLSFAAGTTSVASISFGSTGLTPSTATTGAVTVAGTLVAVNGGTGQSSYTTGDILYASSSTALSKLGVGATGTVLHGGVTPSYSAVSLTADVSGVLPSANGGTGVNNSTSTITLGGSLTTTGAFASTFAMTGATTVTFPTTGTLLSTTNATGNFVSSFSAGSTGLTPTGSNTGAVTLAGTLNLTSGGTNASLTATAGGIVYSTASALAITAAGTAGQFVLSGGAGAPTFLTNSTPIDADSLTTTLIVGTTFNFFGTANQVSTTAGAQSVTFSVPSTFIAPGSIKSTTTTEVGGNLTVDGYTYESAATGIAAAGTTQGGATALTKSYNVVTTSTAGSATGVKLPASGVGLEITVVNASTNTISVYPTGTDVIDGEIGGAASLPVPIPAGGSATYQSVNAGNWYTIDPVVTVSGAGLGIAYSPGETTLSNTGVTSFATTLTGLTVSPSTGAVSLGGTLGVASGGTGAATLTAHAVLLGEGTSTLGFASPGAQYSVLQANASGDPSFGTVNLASSAAVGTSILGSANGGTGVNNGASTLILGGSLTTSGAFASTFTMTGATTVTFPTSGTLISDATIASNAVTSLTSGTTTNSLTVTSNTAAKGAVTVDVNLNAMLQAFGQLVGTGIIVQTGASTFSEVTITGTTGNIDVTNGNGVAGNPTLNLATVTPASSGSFDKFTTDTFGRVIAYTPVVIGDLTTILGTYYLPETGGTMTGTITMSGGSTVTGLPAPTVATDAANKSYVDAAVAGLEWKAVVQAATTADLGTVTYANGSSGVGATITNAGALAAFAVDGYTAALNDRILVKDETNQTYNGIYNVTTLGSGSVAWVLTRSTDANTSLELNNATVFVTNGTVNKDTGWTQTTANPTIGTNNVVFAQFTGAGTYTAGTGLTLTGNTFSLTSPVATTLGGTGTTTAPTAGQLLVGQTAGTYTPYTVTSGTGISTTVGSGTFQINNTGVTSIVAGTGISVSGATGAVTVNNTGVTSVALAAPSIFTVSGSPVTTTGTLTFALNTQAANTVFAGPTTGSAVPTFRALTTTDISTIAVTSIDFGTTGLTPGAATSGAVTVAGTLVVSNGGTGATTLTQHGVVLGNGTSPVNVTAVGATGTVLAGTGADPTFTALNTLAVTSIAGTTNEITASASVGAVTLSLPSTVVLPGSLEVTTTSKFDGLMYETTASVTAAGTSQATATAITAAYNIVTTTGTGEGVTLPVPAYAGAEISIVNIGSNSIAVYPNAGGTIDAVASNGPITVPAGGTWTGQASTTTQWYSIDPVVVNGTGITTTYSNGQTVISNTGVLSFAGGTTGLLPSGATAGNVTLTGVLNPVNGGTGVANSNTSTLTLGGALTTSGAFASTFTMTATTAVTFPTSGTLLSTANIASSAVTSFQTSLTGLTPSTATNGVVTLAGTLGVASGGTGATTLSAHGVVIGNGASAVNVTTAGTQYQALVSNGASADPTFQAIALNQAAAVTGTLPVGNGGTGLTAVGAAGTVLASNGSTNVYQQMQYWATGAFTASVAKTITHNLGQQYVLVQVYDTTGGTPSQIIPDAIVLTSSTAISVTLNQSLATALVVVTGLANASNGTF